MQLRLTEGAKSFSPFMKVGNAYSSLPLKRKFAKDLAAKARTFGLGLEISFKKVLIASLAKFWLELL